MNPIIRLAAIGIVAAVAIGGAIVALRPASEIGPAAPTPSSTADPVAPGPPGFDVVHVSDLYGYGVRYPATWSLETGVIANNPDYIPELAEGRADVYSDTLSGHGLMITSAPLSATTKTLAAWSSLVAERLPRKFPIFADARCVQSNRTLVVDGEPANEVDFLCADRVSLWVTVIHAGLAYQIVWLDDGSVDADYLRPLLDKFLQSFTFTR